MWMLGYDAPKHFGALYMKWMLVGAALAIVGVLVGFAFATQIDMQARAKWWDLMTAFGTVGAVVVALAVPLWQNWDRRREQKAVEMEGNWIAAHTVHRTTHRIRALLDRWDKRELPSSLELSALDTRLHSLQDRVVGLGAATIVSDLASIASELAGVAKKIENANSIRAARRDRYMEGATFGPGLSTPQMLSYIERTEDLQKRCTNWMSRILAEADRAGVTLPGVVRVSTGEAAAELKATLTDDFGK